MPISARRRESHWLLVSRFWPLVISLPIEMISAIMRDFIRRGFVFPVQSSTGGGTPKAMAGWHALRRWRVGTPCGFAKGVVLSQDHALRKASGRTTHQF